MLEHIARLNAKSLNFLSTGGGGGGSGSYTNEDIAGALAGIKHPLGSILLRTMIAGQEPADMYRAWEGEVVKIAAREGWKAKQASTISRLAYATLNEHMDCRCKDCMGRGIIRKRPAANYKLPESPVFDSGYLIIECPRCLGTGKGAQNASMRGRLMGMKPNSYGETWHERYEMLLLELTRIQRDAEDDYKRQFKRR